MPITNNVSSPARRAYQPTELCGVEVFVHSLRPSGAPTFDGKEWVVRGKTSAGGSRVPDVDAELRFQPLRSFTRNDHPIRFAGKPPTMALAHTGGRVDTLGEYRAVVSMLDRCLAAAPAGEKAAWREVLAIAEKARAVEAGAAVRGSFGGPVRASVQATFKPLHERIAGQIVRNTGGYEAVPLEVEIREPSAERFLARISSEGRGDCVELPAKGGSFQLRSGPFAEGAWGTRPDGSHWLSVSRVHVGQYEGLADLDVRF